MQSYRRASKRPTSGLFRFREWSPRAWIAVTVLIVIAVLLTIYISYLRSQDRTLALEVTDSGGQAVALARVYIDEGPRLLTDEGGHLLVEGIPGMREIQLHIEHSDYVVFDERIEPRSFNNGQTVKVVLYKPSRLVGVVTNGEGEPIEGVDLHFQQGSSYARSAADGTFSIENVVQGERTLIYGRGEEVVELAVTIEPESVTEIELTLGPKPTPTPRPTATPTPSSEPTAEPTPSPTSQPTSPPTPPPADGTFIYRAVSGDSLTGIARKFNAPYSEIYQLNPRYHSNPDFLPVGGEVVVPCTQLAIQQGYCD